LFKSATDLLEDFLRLLREKETSALFPYGIKYKVTPFLKLLMTPHLRTLNLTNIRKGSDISDVLRLAAIRSPVREEKRLQA
jgi:hypothetical protein